MEHTEKTEIIPKPVDKQKVSKLWKIAGILGIITAIEFFLAFTMPRGILLYSVFVGLTLVKAFYIVSEFMHLKYEVKSLIWSIMLPVIFVIWLIIALLAEGGAVFNTLF
jgi:cytochrome c oxidase subunit IV